MSNLYLSDFYCFSDNITCECYPVRKVSKNNKNAFEG